MTIKLRCANCMRPHREHRPRMEAAPTCPDFKGTYREATEAELEAGYKDAFPDGMPEPIATFRADNPDDVAQLKRTFGPGGGGMPAFIAAIEGKGA